MNAEHFVIMCNDTPKGIHVGTEAGAKKVCDRLCELYYRNRGWYDCFGKPQTFEEYKNTVFWRVYALEVTRDEP